MGLGAAAIGAVTSVAGFLGADATVAATIGAIGGPALLGAGAGAVTGAVTHGNVLDDALLGGVTGGIGGAAGVAGPALGLGSGATEALGAGGGALAGAGISAATGQNPLTGALAGGLGGYGGASSALGGLGAATDSASTPVSGTGGVLGAPSTGISSGDMAGLVASSDQLGANAGAPGVGAAAGNAVDNADVTASLTGSGSPTNSLNPQSAVTAAGAGGGGNAASGSGLYGSDNSGASGALSGSGKGAGSGNLLSGLGSNGVLTLAAISGLSSLLNKPQQAAYGNTPGPAQAAANLGPLYNAPLAPSGTGRTPVAPAVNYYTYGSQPEQTFFQNNSLGAYGFAKGGALNGEFMTSPASTNHVRGPGGPTEDKIPAALSNGEYVLTASEVSRAGDGSNTKGARRLDKARKTGALSQVIKRAAA